MKKAQALYEAIGEPAERLLNANEELQRLQWQKREAEHDLIHQLASLGYYQCLAVRSGRVRQLLEHLNEERAKPASNPKAVA